MTKRFLGCVVMGVLVFGGAWARAEDTLAQWATGYAQPEIQIKILKLIFPDLDTSARSGTLEKTQGTYLFPQDDSWLQLGKVMLWNPPTAPQGKGYLIVTCLLRRRPDQDPLNATSYLLRDTEQSPVALSGGYSTDEQVHKIDLPKLKKSFLVLEDTFSPSRGARSTSGVFVLALIGDPPVTPLPTVWGSRPSDRYFQIGFTPLSENTPEELVLRTVPGPQKPNSSGAYGGPDMSTDNGPPRYAAYRWNGDRFESDDFALEDQIKALPESVWQFGTGR
jgi:hypothetical protein